MDSGKQQTVKRHMLLVSIGIVTLLTLVSLTIPFDTDAPAMPGDDIHQQTKKEQECLTCHSNDETAAKPMKHPPKANCTFCHLQK